MRPSTFVKVALWRLFGHARIGAGTRIHWQSRYLQEGSGVSRLTIGRKCRIGPFAVLSPYGGSITLGDRVTVHPFTILYGQGGLVVGNGVRIAAHVTIIPMNHGFEDVSIPIHAQKGTTKGIRIDDDVWIGTGARILDGVHIAEGCVIAAGAVVTKSTEPYGLYAGVPARLIRKRGERLPQSGENVSDLAHHPPFS